MADPRDQNPEQPSHGGTGGDQDGAAPPDGGADTRPMGPYGFLWETSWNAILLQVSAFTLLLVAFLPAPPDLGRPGLRALGIFVVCLTLWITQALPPAITGLLALSLLALYGVLPAHEAFALFGNTAVFFILGAFILAAAIMKSGLSKRGAVWMLARFGGSPGRLLFGVLFMGWFFSLFMSEHAVAAALLPVVLELVRATEEAAAAEAPEGSVAGARRGARIYGKGLLICLAWGTIVGGTGTLLGGARGPLALGILRSTTGESIGFFEYSRALFPATVGLLPISFGLAWLLWGRSRIPMESLRRTLESQARGLDRISAREKGTGVVFLLTVLSWILLGRYVDLAVIAILAAVSLFLFRLVSWRDTEEYVNWGILLMYGGAVALGAALSESGAAGWASRHLLQGAVGQPLLLLLLLGLIASILTEGMSNAAVVALLLPIGLSLTDASGLSGVPVALAISLASGLDYCLPTGAPPVAIVYSSGRLEIRDTLLPGLILLSLTWAAIYLLIRYWWPWIGVVPGY